MEDRSRRHYRYYYAAENPNLPPTPPIVWDDQVDLFVDQEETERLRNQRFMEELDNMIANIDNQKEKEAKEKKAKKKKPSKSSSQNTQRSSRGPPPPPPPPSLGGLTIR